MQKFGAGQIEKCLVYGQWLHQRRQFLHHAADLATDGAVFFHVGFDNNGLGTCFQRLEHRHCRTNAMNTRDVTCC
ncbi:hypothetical protein D3C80_2050920 [compost metagenome]